MTRKGGGRESGEHVGKPRLSEAEASSVKRAPAAADPAANIICTNMPTHTANVRTYEHGLPEHEYYCGRIRELEGLNSIQRDALAEQTNAIRELEAELTQWKQMWKPHCETDRAIEE